MKAIDQYKEFFQENYEKYNTDIKALGWTKESQQRRFEVLLEIGDTNNKSILDVGCGFGDFRKLLTTPFYTGIDLVPEFIAEAKKHNNGKFLVHSIDSYIKEYPFIAFDYVFASGIFFMKHRNWNRYVLDKITQMFKLCTKGIAINFISKYAPNKEGKKSLMHYTDPSVVLNLAMKISNKVILKHNYLPNDFTLYIYR